MKLGDERRIRRQQDVDGKADFGNEPANHLPICELDEEQAIRAGIAVGAGPAKSLLETRLGSAGVPLVLNARIDVFLSSQWETRWLVRLAAEEA